MPAGNATITCGEGATAHVVETEILDAAFTEPLLQIAVGTTVQWMNTSTVTHQVVFADQSIESSALLRKGDVFRVLFVAPGEFPYICGPHPFMSGVVTVSAA